MRRWEEKARMTSIIKMTPLSGGGDESPHCHLLEVDGFSFLLDLGWSETFDMEFINNLKKVVPKIDAVLLSYPDCPHLGALPYAVGKLGLNCPIYATVPVYKMGQMFLYDVYQARHNIEEFSLFTLDEVDASFEKITQLKYNQTVQLKGKGQGLAITPIPAGHMLGGTIWRIVKDGEEEIVYAVDYNHKKERHLNGCDIERLSRPSLLITDAFNAGYSQQRRRLRDEQLMTNILTTLRASGNVLVCVDTAGRVLELAHMMDQLWGNKDSGLLAYSLALLNNVAFNVVEFAKSQIDWMSEKLMNMFREKRSNPFQFRHLKLCHSMAEVNKVPAPKVVLASMPDMECGFARELFLQWCSNPKNSVILTCRSSPGTLARQLLAHQGDRDRVIPLEVRRRIKLTGAELEEFRVKEKEKDKKTVSSLVEAALDEESDSDEEEMEVVQGKGGDKGKQVKHDIVMKPESAKKQTGFFKSNKSRFPMYPCHEEKIKYDDYGEIIRPEDFMMDVVEAASSLDAHAVLPQEEVEDEGADREEVPTKCVSSLQQFAVKCSVQFIDFEGRTDGESICKLLQQLRPRRCILVRGSEESLNSLRDFCAEVVEGDNNIFVPKNLEVVDATTERFIYQVRLRDSLFSTLKFSKAKDAQLAWLDGVIKMTEEDKADLRPVEGEEEEKTKAVIPMLHPLPEEAVQGHSSNFVNELKLSDFKLVLTRNGIPSEFQMGNLLCGHGSNVQLRRHDSGRVMIEGCVSEDYYLIRDLLYQQYAIV